MHRTALLSRDRRLRYRLGRRWGEGAALCFALLNPSTADETREDATVRRCLGFARSLGFGALEVVNLYAYVATDPAELRRAGYPVGRGNDRHIEAAAGACGEVASRGACTRRSWSGRRRSSRCSAAWASSRGACASRRAGTRSIP